jgi:DNA-binding response OmpR family regulator
MQHSPLHGRSLLVVEDEPLIAFDIEQELSEAGANVSVTSVLDEAAILLENDGLSAAILDHGIGNSNSSLLYERLNEQGLPFIIYSAYDVLEKDRQGGVLVSKPALPGALVAAVEKLLRRLDG